MRNFVFPVAAAALIATSFAAFAGDTMTTGTIKSMDMAKHTLVLDNGISYILPAAFKDPGLKVGEKVTIGWVLKGKAYDADTVVIAK
jgi:Protein of unknown function (DUF1344)